MLMMLQDPASSRRCGAETDSRSDVGGPVDDGREHNQFQNFCFWQWSWIQSILCVDNRFGVQGRE